MIKKYVIPTVVILAIAVLYVSCTGGSSNSSGDSSVDSSEDVASSSTFSETEEISITPAGTAADQALADYIVDTIVAWDTKLSIDGITINDNAGTAAEGDVIALVYLTWKVKNKADTTKEMLRLFSDDLAAHLAQDYENVQEVAVFWEVEYLQSNGKLSYGRTTTGGMLRTDETYRF